jgi:hypothetical protein
MPFSGVGKACPDYQIWLKSVKQLRRSKADLVPNIRFGWNKSSSFCEAKRILPRISDLIEMGQVSSEKQSGFCPEYQIWLKSVKYLLRSKADLAPNIRFGWNQSSILCEAKRILPRISDLVEMSQVASEKQSGDSLPTVRAMYCASRLHVRYRANYGLYYNTYLFPKRPWQLCNDFHFTLSLCLVRSFC